MATDPSAAAPSPNSRSSHAPLATMNTVSLATTRQNVVNHIHRTLG